MKTKKCKTMRASSRDQRSALASPLRLEILGLFTSPDPLAITDMAGIMGRTAGSLYHHVGILEKAGLLQRAGTRPKGKRYEALFLPVASRIEIAVPRGDESAANHIVKSLASAFRMAERDLGAALRTGDSLTEGPDRNLFATRMHLRASPKLLARINKHLKAIEDLLANEAAKTPKPSPDDQHLSLTIALLPLKGRDKTQSPKGE
jgi:predicted transcriptional regulator